MQRAGHSSSFFGGISARELNGYRVRKSPHLGNLSSDSGGAGSGVLGIEHDGYPTPPLALSFSKTSGRSHLLMVSDEDGYVSLYDTRRRLPSLASCRGKRGQGLISEWVAHNNAIFDLCWIKDDTQILTASGDMTMKIWDAERTVCTAILRGHTGTVRSVCSHSSNPDLLVSGSSDGSFALWDLRCKSSSTNSRGEECLSFTASVKEAHTSKGKSGRQRKASCMSVTSVLYLKDELSIVSAGAVDSIVKFWDIRNLKSSFARAHPCGDPPLDKEKSFHGISCLSQDPNGVFIAASCMDNSIYMYNVLHLDKSPLEIFSGSAINSFYVKIAISPDGAHILGGSSDHSAYIWQVDKPSKAPVSLKGHGGEVTAVDWCSSEIGKLATSSDDNTVRVWNINKGSCISTQSPSSIRKRVTAFPSFRCRKLVMDEPPTGPPKDPLEKSTVNPTSPVQTQEIEFRTPESGRKRNLSFLLNEVVEMQKSPEAASNSPSSVLSPPSSIKRRTIRDYFASS